MPDRCSKFKESKHSTPIFCRIISAQRGEEYSFVPWRGLPSGILSFCLRKSVGFLGEVWALACSLETFWCACLRLFDIRSRERGRRLLAQIQQSLLDWAMASHRGWVRMCGWFLWQLLFMPDRCAIVWRIYIFGPDFPSHWFCSAERSSIRSFPEEFALQDFWVFVFLFVVEICLNFLERLESCKLLVKLLVLVLLPTSDLKYKKYMVEGCWRWFNSHCLIERWQDTVWHRGWVRMSRCFLCDGFSSCQIGAL